MCLNKKVLIGLGTLLAGLFLIRPAWAGAALPLLIVASCPLSMLFMARGMRGPGAQASGACATGSHDQVANAPALSADKIDKRISELQVELRCLKSAQARQFEGDAPLGSDYPVNLTK